MAAIEPYRNKIEPIVLTAAAEVLTRLFDNKFDFDWYARYKDGWLLRQLLEAE